MLTQRVDVHEKALSLPHKPGVYLMLNKNREIIYVGKAKRLINRVSSYFRENPNHNYKTAVMVKQVWDFDYIVTDTEFEALVLENSLIKRHQPKYNILLKDDKGYPFIRLDVNSNYPDFSVVSKPLSDGARYFGPYSGRSASRAAIDAVKAALKLPSCTRKFPRDIGKARPCLNAHLGRCCAVCSGNVSQAEYAAKIEQAIELFEGKTDDLISRLKSEMERFSDAMEFEKAAKVRDEIRAIERLEIKQKVLSGIMADTDVIAIAVGESRVAFSVLHYIGGALLESEVELVDTPVYSDISELLFEFIKQYYMPRKMMPREIYLSDEIYDSELLRQWLESICEHRVYINVPKRGDKHRLTEMARENAQDKLRIAVSEDEVSARSLSDLQHILGLPMLPHTIESYDISNTAGSEQVASMIVFSNAKPARSKYRKFKIKTLSDQDDVRAMREVVERRMRRYLDGDDKFSPLPDLILLDGGKGQTNAINALLSEMGIEVPVFGMVKDDRHRTRAIISPNGNEVGITANPAVFKLVGTIQEEVHRVAISYHRSLRSRAQGSSTLEKIPGIGEARRRALMRHFKSVAAIKEADFEELCKVVSKDAALSVYKFFNKEN